MKDFEKVKKKVVPIQMVQNKWSANEIT